MAAVFLGTILVWVARDRTPPSWDDAYYLSNSLLLHDAIAKQGLPGLATQFLHLMRIKPPLVPTLAIPAYWIAGRNFKAAYGVNIASMLVVLYTVFRFGRKYCGSRGGVLAVIIAGSMPMLYGLSHWFLVELCLIAIVCATIWVTSDAADMKAPSRYTILGALLGLGLLTKMSYPLYVLAPIGYFLFRVRKTPGSKRGLSASLLVAGAIALPWYMNNLVEVSRRALQAGSAETARTFATGEIFSASAIVDYIRNLVNVGPAIYFVSLLFLICILGRRVPLSGKNRHGLILSGLWFSPIVVLCFSHYRDLRYAAPLFPAVAIAMAILWDRAICAWPATIWLAAGAMVLALVGMLHASFRILGDRSFTLGGLLLVEPRFEYARPYGRVYWPHEMLLSDLVKADPPAMNAKRVALVGTDTGHFNADNLRLTAAQMELPLDFQSTAYETDLPALTGALRSSAYFVYEEGGEADAANLDSNRLWKMALNEVKLGGEYQELPISRGLPDGGRVHVYANQRARGPLRTSAFVDSTFKHLPPCEAVFGDQVKLETCSVLRASR